MINEQFNFFNSTLMNIFSNFIPNKTVTFNDQDPPWSGDKIKPRTELKNMVNKEYIKNGRSEDLYYLLQNLTRKILLISQNAKMINLYVLQKTLMILLGP